MKDWPEEKKKFFALSLAVLITAVMVITWYEIHPIFNNTDGQKTAVSSSTIDDMNNSIRQISEEFAKFKELFGTSTASSTEVATSTENSTSSSSTSI